MTQGGRFSNGRFAAGRFMSGRFSGPVAAAPAAPAAPSNLALPEISPPGSCPAGTLVTCFPGSWRGHPAPAFAYQWQRGGADIVGETSISYQTVSTDAGESVACVVTATNSEGSALAAAAPVMVLDELAPPENSVAPAIAPAGVQAEGTVLSVSAGLWSGNPAPVYAYQWRRDGADIAGATGPSYTVAAVDAGTAISCLVSGSNPAGTAVAASNAVSVPARVAPTNVVAPMIAGSGTIPATLTVTQGSWQGNPAPTYAYQWQRGGSDIPGATGVVYVTAASDGGTTIACRVTASNSEGSASAVSNGLSVSLDAPAMTWPATVLAAHLGRTGDVSATRWDDVSGQGNHMALVGSPAVAADGDALVVRFNGATQSGVIANAAARWNGAGFDGPVNIAVTARYYPSDSVGVLVGGARASDYAIAADLNSGVNLVRNNASNGPNVIGTPTEAGTLVAATALIDDVHNAMDAAAAMDPSKFQTIVVRDLKPNTAWSGMTFLRDGDGSHLAADVVAVTFWTGSSAGDESDIIGLHARAVTGL